VRESDAVLVRQVEGGATPPGVPQYAVSASDRQVLARRELPSTGTNGAGD